MRKYNISICGIQEHRKVHSVDREQEINRYDVDPGYDLYTISAWINQVQAANGDVGIIIRKESIKSLISIKRVTNRIMIANFQSNPILTTIVTYALSASFMLLCLVDFCTIVPYLLPYPFIYCTYLKLFSFVQ